MCLRLSCIEYFFHHFGAMRDCCYIESLGTKIILFAVLSSVLSFVTSDEIEWNLDLPNNHIPFVLSHHRDLAKSCFQASNCPYRDLIDQTSSSCWGYEDGCQKKESYSNTETKGCKTKAYHDDFWIRADFGFVDVVLKETADTRICTPTGPDDSSLICSKCHQSENMLITCLMESTVLFETGFHSHNVLHYPEHLKYCKAENLYIDFREHHPGNDRFKPDMFQHGMIGGHCDFNLTILREQNERPYPLHSWYSELQNYTRLDFQPLKDRSKCDVILEKPTVLMKLDSGINLYHHFCDFFNLYLSQHVNNSWFDTDIQIIMWDTSSLGYFDIFSDAWKAFTKHPIINLEDWTGKRVCLQEAMFSLLPRMIGGLYYNSYIPHGCVGSSMFRAFSEHFLHRMGVTQDPSLPEDRNSTKIRVTLLERGKPEDEHIYRKVKNQPELVEVLDEFPEFEIKVVQYNWKEMSLVEQLKITHNSDIFIGMHGAGLLHFLFLPDWAVAFELYNCGDDGCYHDLARLRGLDYITWQDGKVEAFDQGKHRRYGDNPKFWNYSFDPNEFRVLVKKARELLLNNTKFLERWKPLENKVDMRNEL